MVLIWGWAVYGWGSIAGIAVPELSKSVPGLLLSHEAAFETLFKEPKLQALFLKLNYCSSENMLFTIYALFGNLISAAKIATPATEYWARAAYCQHPKARLFWSIRATQRATGAHLGLRFSLTID